MIRNLFNIVFIIVLFFVILLGLWESISPYSYNKPVNYFDYGSIKSVKKFEPPNFSSNLFIPLGCDEDKYDYAVVLSNAFKYNLNISIIVSIIFILTGIIFGLCLGFKNEEWQIKNLNFNNYKYTIKNIIYNGVSILTDTFQSIPSLIILLLSVIYFEIIFFDSDNRLLYTLIVFAIVSTPKLSIQLSSIVKQLKREEFILAAKASGMSMLNLIFKQILYYELRGLLIIQFANFFVQSIMIEVLLSWLGKGASGNSLGIMIRIYNRNLGMGFKGDSTQEMIIILAPYILLILLCFCTRWIANRMIILMGN